MDNRFNNFGRKISWVQILFILSIILLTFCDFLTLSSNAKGTGTPLFIVGASTVLIAAIKKSTLKGRLWLLADGVATLVLSTLLLSGITAPFYFALWEISLGLFKIGESLQLKSELSSNSRGFLYIGIAEVLSGAGFFIKSTNRPTELSVAIILAFSIQKIAYALRYYFYPLMSEKQ